MIPLVCIALILSGLLAGLAIGATILRDWLDWRGFYRAKRTRPVVPVARVHGYTRREQRQLKRNRADLRRALERRVVQ